MKFGIIAITFILGIIGWFKQDSVPIYVAAIVVLLLILVAIFQLFDERNKAKEKEKNKNSGVIEPIVKTLMSSDDDIYPQLEFGDGGTILKFTGPTGSPMFRLFQDSHITIVVEDDQLKISTKIRSKNGIVAELMKNEWHINPNNSFDRNFSENAIEVKDHEGDIVFQVKHVGDRIQLQGKFYDVNGNGIALVKGPGGEGGAMVPLRAEMPDNQSQIEPMFKYPSALHIGEMNN